MTRMAVLAVLLAMAATAPLAAQTPDLERKLLGEWKGPACGGDWTYRADGTFSAVHYSPGGNELTGTWEVRWSALPATLIRTCKTSDDTELVGKSWEVKLVQLDQEALAYQYPDQFPSGHTVRYSRLMTSLERELAALQGKWIPLQYEEGGKKGDAAATRHIIRGDKIIIEVSGNAVTEGKVVLDVTKTPTQLTLEFPDRPTNSIIYVRAGDYVIYCGNRSATRPSEFASGTAQGGEYLIAWRIER